MSLDDEIKILSDTEEYYKLMLFGDPGGGKTTLAAGSPNPLYVDYERSSDVLRYYNEYRDTPIIRPLQIKGANPGNRWTKTKKLVEEAVKDDRFGTVVFDTYAGVVRSCEDEICSAKGKDLPDWPIYREVQDIQTDFLNWLQDVDKHVIYICHAVTKKDDTTGVIEIRTNLSPGMADILYRIVNVAGYLQVTTSLKGETTRKMLVTAGGKQFAKNRLRIKDAYIDEPTFDKLLKAEKDTSPVGIAHLPIQ